MAGLSAALNFARTSLASVSGQTSVASRNIANANNTDYSRKSANVISLSGSAPLVAGSNRASDKYVQEKLLTSTATSAASKIISESTKSLAEIIGDPASEQSPAGKLAKFQISLQKLEQFPHDKILAQNVIQSATGLVQNLHDAGATVHEIRQAADKKISENLETINHLLQDYQKINDNIIRGDKLSEDYMDELDNRDRIIKQLSEFIGIKSVIRENNDVALYTETGVTLFEEVPRKIIFQPTSPLSPGQKGNPILIDGVDITSAQGPMAIRSGALYGLSLLRDDITLTAEAQLDEIARALITNFAERDQSTPATANDMAGLFTDGSTTTIPPAGLLVSGLARTISLNPLYNPAKSGNLNFIRDGGANGSIYQYNQASAAGYAKRITSLVNSFEVPINFSGNMKLTTNDSVKKLSLASAAWAAEINKQAQSASDIQTAIKTKAHEALQRVTGVSIDDEMTDMLQFERSYQASAKLLTTIDTMLDALFAAVN